MNPLESWTRGAALRVSLPRLRGGRGRHRARRAVPAARRRGRGAGGDLARAAHRERPSGARRRSYPTRARGSSRGWCGGSARGRSKGVLAAMKVRGMADLRRRGRSAMPATALPVAGGGVEHRHRGLGGGGNLRAAVFGVNDGLVSNASLILGVAGASVRSARRRADRRRRPRRRRVRDGRRRVRVGAVAARALRVPDRASSATS